MFHSLLIFVLLADQIIDRAEVIMMKDLIDREVVLEELSCTRPSPKDRPKYLQWLADNKAILEVPLVQSDCDEWCTDCKEYDVDNHCCPRFNKVIREALKEGLAESTDAISRQVAIDIIQSYKKNTERLKEISVEDVVDMFEDLIDDIENESSVQPVRENGTWEKDELFGESAYVCTNCETIWTTGQIKNMHYCPTCGSDMREGR